ncbi:MAG TPA: hypothetical protein VMT53_23115 [Terriglobales bacterium]|nr:hypothetical protein [Terriglobales bacterium]
MPLLILAIASFLVFVAIAVLLSIAGTPKSRALRHQTRLEPTNRPALFSIAEAFDPIYSVLWEAPVAALEIIDSARASGIPVARLHAIYREAAARFPEFYDGCSFIAWLQFLEDARMISWHGAHLVLTPEGQAFLRFRFVTDAMVEV